jgi:hypothetical protein
MHIHGGMWRTPVFNKCLAKFEATASPSWRRLPCTGLSEDGETGAGVNYADATLHYRVIKASALYGVWDMYVDALDNVVSIIKKGANVIISPEESSYYAGIIVTRRKDQPLPHSATDDDVFVIVYAPITDDTDKGLGRGHFVKRNHPDVVCP